LAVCKRQKRGLGLEHAQQTHSPQLAADRFNYRDLGNRLTTGCCPDKNSFERSLKCFLSTNLGEAEDQRLQLFESEGRVLKSPGASLRFVKKRFRPSEKGFGQQSDNT